MKPSTARRLIAALPALGFLFLMGSAPVFCQQLISAKAGIIQFIQGEAALNGKPLRLKDGDYIQMENGQVLTTEKGYAELLLSPDACLRMGENTSFRMRQNSLTDTQLELNRGSVLIEILKKLKTDPIRIHTSGSIIEMKKEGLYRLDSEAGRLRVYGGDARAIKGKKKVRVKNGRTVLLDGKLRPDKFDVDDTDELHHWAARRSFGLYAKNLFFAERFAPGYLTWISRPEGIYNSHYRVTLAANEAWSRYWYGVTSVMMRRMNKRTRSLMADPGPLPRNSPPIPTPNEQN